MLIFVRPAREGLLVRNHQDKFRPLPEGGQFVEKDSTWTRRINSGDVIEGEPEKTAKPAPVAEAKPAREKLSVRKTETKKSEVN